MFRRLAAVAFSLGLVACSNCKAPCKQGITFYVAEVAGALSRGRSADLHICLDGNCGDVTITRDNVGGSVFVPLKGVGKDIDHDLTVTGGSSFKGEYKGKLTSYIQNPGSGCSSCALATVKIAADGQLTPGVPAVAATTTTVAGSP